MAVPKTAEATARKLIANQRALRELFAENDELLASLRKEHGGRHGSRFQIDGSTTARLVDNFRGKQKLFKTAFFPRWSLDVEEA